jgi:hypothetical protein
MQSLAPPSLAETMHKIANFSQVLACAAICMGSHRPNDPPPRNLTKHHQPRPRFMAFHTRPTFTDHIIPRCCPNLKDLKIEIVYSVDESTDNLEELKRNHLRFLTSVLKARNELVRPDRLTVKTARIITPDIRLKGTVYSSSKSPKSSVVCVKALHSRLRERYNKRAPKKEP